MSSSSFLTKLRENNAFGIIEALISMTFMMLVLVALLGLLSMSVKAISSSKVSTIATQMANESMEKVRSKSYDQVGVIDGNPSGILPIEETKSVSGINFTINYEVIWVDDSIDGTSTADASGPEDYKQVTVRVNWTEKGTARTISTSTFIKPKLSQSEPPTVNFIHGDPGLAMTPPDGTVFGAGVSSYDDWFNNNTVPLKASATDPENDLVLMRFYIDSLYADGLTPSGGLYRFNPVGSYENDPICRWYPSTTDSSGTPLWGEGTHEVMVEVWDSHGLRDARTIFWTIDKEPPEWIESEPANLTAQALDDTRIMLSWQAAWDGSDKVKRYRVYRQAGEGGITVIENDLNTPTFTYTNQGLTQWTTYQYHITALSAGGRESAATSNIISAKTMFLINGTPGKVQGKRIVTVQWNSPPDGVNVDHYNLYRDNVIDGQVENGVKVNTNPIAGNLTSFVDNNNNSVHGLPSKTTYEYKMVAYSSADDSVVINQSVVRQVTTSN